MLGSGIDLSDDDDLVHKLDLCMAPQQYYTVLTDVAVPSLMFCLKAHQHRTRFAAGAWASFEPEAWPPRALAVYDAYKFPTVAMSTRAIPEVSLDTAVYDLGFAVACAMRTAYPRIPRCPRSLTGTNRRLGYKIHRVFHVALKLDLQRLWLLAEGERIPAVACMGGLSMPQARGLCDDVADVVCKAFDFWASAEEQGIGRASARIDLSDFPVWAATSFFYDVARIQGFLLELMQGLEAAHHRNMLRAFRESGRIRLLPPEIQERVQSGVDEPWSDE